MDYVQYIQITAWIPFIISFSGIFISLCKKRPKPKFYSFQMIVLIIVTLANLLSAINYCFFTKW